MELEIREIAHQRNGVEGEGFCVVVFDDDGPAASRKVAVVFDQPGCCAVLDLEKLGRGVITQKLNGWRGDRFEPHLRKAIKRHDRTVIREEFGQAGGWFDRLRSFFKAA